MLKESKHLGRRQESGVFPMHNTHLFKYILTHPRVGKISVKIIFNISYFMHLICI